MIQLISSTETIEAYIRAIRIAFSSNPRYRYTTGCAIMLIDELMTLDRFMDTLYPEISALAETTGEPIDTDLQILLSTSTISSRIIDRTIELIGVAYSFDQLRQFIQSKWRPCYDRYRFTD